MILRLDEETHTYIDDQQRKWISVTDLVRRYRQPFDERAVSIAYAKKHGQTPEYWLSVWKEKGNDGRRFGNALHQMKSDQATGRSLVKFRNSVRYVKNHNFFKDLSELEDGVYVEVPLGLDTYLLAGTPDEINIETVGSLKYVDINDHKTNKQIRTEGYRSGGSSARKMLFPINHMDDCEYTHHCLQVSFYAYILEMHGFTPRHLSFTHYRKDSPNSDPKVYTVEYKKREVKLILNHLRQSWRTAK